MINCVRRGALWIALCVWMPLAWADAVPLNAGPYNMSFLQGSIGVTRPLSGDSPLVSSMGSWSIAGWMRATQTTPGVVIITGIGDTTGGLGSSAWRGIYLDKAELGAFFGGAATLKSGVKLLPDRWYAVALTYDGAVARLYVDGALRGMLRVALSAIAPRLDLAPAAAAFPPRPWAHFGGNLALWSLRDSALSAEEIGQEARALPDFSRLTVTRVGVGWPWQEHAWRGLQEPQDPWTLPQGHSAPSAPIAMPSGPKETVLRGEGAGTWSITDWHLAAAPQVPETGERLSLASYDAASWYAAVVPGTVLTTLIARGVYADPDFGLNNLSIPDSLSRQDYWYRSVFASPAGSAGRDLTLKFKGINYAAEVWLNGHRVGNLRGAFTRGSFDVTGLVYRDQPNAIAVRVSPPPHPGIPHEQSIAAGPGNNGGAMAIDGPTFIAAEGWDWIPGIRDRNTGLWQGVEIHATGPLRLGDPQVVSHLPLPRTDSADIDIRVPVENRRDTVISGVVVASFDDVRVEKRALLRPGLNDVSFTSREFRQLHLTAPRLWWPNGYGAPNLYSLKLHVQTDTVSDSMVVRFGVRELTYELSLFDANGRLRRVEVDPTLGAMRGERLIDVRHEAIKRTPQGWAPSLTAAGETSPAVRPIDSETLTPYLVIRVNGVRIAARGGSWGMDDSRKRISRERLEPYFRLHRDANLNVIRNWLGQNTEEVFYDLADEYGLLILNDFWVSTEDFQMEPEDPALFLSNARDVISRYRNHPSIAVWFGRNEGVPQPILNEGLAELVATLDGTRHYTGSSNAVNLQGSGPYNYQPPGRYFTGLARGFSVEVGTPSLSTLEALRASIPAADQWPLNDTFAYHDWHFGGNGDVATFMAALSDQYGAGSSLEDFERKAQLMNYVSYRAIFEGFQAHLWTENSGRLLWMTHPSWPSNTWQIYSSDYDTGAAYYGVKKACEAIHAQLNLPDFGVAVVNSTRTDAPGLVLRSRILALDGRLLGERADRLDAPADATTTLRPLAELPPSLAREHLVLVKLALTDRHGTLLSENLYWQSLTPADQTRLNTLPPEPVDLQAHFEASATGPLVRVRLRNTGAAAALNAKMTLLDESGGRVLPAYYSDNYVSLLPGESRDIDIRYPVESIRRGLRVALRGWNVAPATAEVVE